MIVITNEILGGLEFGDDGAAFSKLDVAGLPIELDVTFEEGTPNGASVAKAVELVRDAGAVDQAARKAMAADLATGDDDSALKLFRNHHVEELATEDLLRCFAVATVADIATDEVFLRGLKLKRVGLYPEDPEAMLICDYTLQPTVTDYLISVTFDAAGAAVAVDMES